MIQNSYLDYAATTPLKPEILALMAEVLAAVGNASSVHAYGRDQRERVEHARRTLAGHFAVKPAQVIFTSGATEANVMAMKGIRAASLIISAIEHASIMAPAVQAERIRVNPEGMIDLNYLEELLKALPQPALVAAMLVNNETGVIQPVKEVAALAKRYGAFVHCDAVQAVGKLSFTFADMGVDSLSLSAHKIGGPQGAGALLLKARTPFQALIEGGGQERGLRAGTENVAAIVGFGAALKASGQDLARQEAWRSWRDGFEAEVEVAGGLIMGKKAPRVATLSCVAMPGVPAETQLMAFDLAGVAVSAGSACSSGKVKASPVLTAMGLGDVAGSALRFSFGWNSRQEELAKAATIWRDVAARRKSPAAA